METATVGPAHAAAAEDARVVVDALGARELLGLTLGHRLAIAAAQGEALDPRDAAREIAGTYTDPAITKVAAAIALGAYKAQKPPQTPSRPRSQNLSPSLACENGTNPFKSAGQTLVTKGVTRWALNRVGHISAGQSPCQGSADVLCTSASGPRRSQSGVRGGGTGNNGIGEM